MDEFTLATLKSVLEEAKGDEKKPQKQQQRKPSTKRSRFVFPEDGADDDEGVRIDLAEDDEATQVERFLCLLMRRSHVCVVAVASHVARVFVVSRSLV